MRVGIGYDIHAFSSKIDRPLLLCGVHFPGEAGLEGHSDADVATHAVCDALLGALALGDIGDHFPPDDPAWRGADSIELLERVQAMLGGCWRVSNVDLSIVAERPKISERRLEMRSRLAQALMLDLSAVSVKATTNERLGSVGRGEGVAAVAIVLLEEVT